MKQSADLRVLDYNGHNVFHSFSFSDLGEPVFYEGESFDPFVPEEVAKVERRTGSLWGSRHFHVNNTLY